MARRQTAPSPAAHRKSLPMPRNWVWTVRLGMGAPADALTVSHHPTSPDILTIIIQLRHTTCRGWSVLVDHQVCHCRHAQNKSGERPVLWAWGTLWGARQWPGMGRPGNGCPVGKAYIQAIEPVGVVPAHAAVPSQKPASSTGSSSQIPATCRGNGIGLCGWAWAHLLMH